MSQKAKKRAPEKMSKPGRSKVRQNLTTEAQTMFQGQNNKKNHRKLTILNQWIEIEVENGQTVTKLYPSNEELIEEGKAMLPPPDLVYRRLNFPSGVPREYQWATKNPEALQRGGTGMQRMTVDTWLELIEREEVEGNGHVGPTGVGNLPRPAEHGICECEVCTRTTAINKGKSNI